MDVRDRVRHLVEEIPPLPEGDPTVTFDAGRRRVRRRRTLTAGGAAMAALVAVALVALPDAGTRQPSISDSPENDEALVPAGWQTITAGQIAVSVPPDWEIARRYEGFEPPEGASLGGPCHTDLYGAQGLGDEAQPPVPVAVVYDRPTDGSCRLPGFDGPPPRPGLVLYETIRGREDTVEEQGVRDRIGQLEVWRTVDDEPSRDLAPSGIVSYVPVDLQGGLWVSHPDDPTVQRILATARPASASQSTEDTSDRRAPTSEHVDSEPDFEFHSVEPPAGWTVDAVSLTPEGSFADDMGVLWLDTRWTPTRGDRDAEDQNGEHRVELVLRQTHMSTLDHDLRIVTDGLTAVELGDGLAFQARGVIIWKRGDTYLELRGPSTPEGLLRDIAATTEPASP